LEPRQDTILLYLLFVKESDRMTEGVVALRFGKPLVNEVEQRFHPGRGHWQARPDAVLLGLT